MSQARKHNAYDLRAILEEIELELIRNLRRNLKHHEKEEEKEGFRWEMWQKAKLRSLANFRKQNREAVEQHSKQIENLINKALQESFDTAEGRMSKLFNKLKSILSRQGIQFPKNRGSKGLDKRPRPGDDFFGMNEKKIDALQETASKISPSAHTEQPKEKAHPEDAYVPKGEEKSLSGNNNDQKMDDLKKQVNRDMKEAQGAIWRRMDDVYRQTIYKAEMHMAAGAKTLDQAVDMTTKEFLAGGIDCIQYKNGHRVNVASYAEMALRTASQRATLLAEGKKRDEWGIHTVFVSAHANTCPKCAPWQGKVLVDDVFSSGTAAEAAELGVPLLSTAIAAGLLHPNCRHTLVTYIPGITVLPTVPHEDEAVKTYKAEQGQRALEQKMRKAKREAAGSCDEGNTKDAQLKLRELQKRMREYLDQHPELRRAYDREKIRDLPSDPKEMIQSGMRMKLPDEVTNITGMTEDRRIKIEKAIEMMQKKYNIHLGEVSVESFTKTMGEADKNTLFIAGPYMEGGKLKMGLSINSDIDYNVIEANIRKRYKTGYYASKSLKDCVKHELAHIMTFQACETQKEYHALKDIIDKKSILGVSGYADSEGLGTEMLAEAFVRMQNGEKVPFSARMLVNKYIERWKK